MGPRSNVKVIRSMQEGSHVRIKSSNTHHSKSRNVEENSDHHRRESNGDPPHLTPDAKGHRYMQALDRLTVFNKRRKKRVRQDRQQAEWLEENSNLKRASQELTKAIEEMLAAMSSKTGGAIAPARIGLPISNDVHHRNGGNNGSVKSDRESTHRVGPDTHALVGRGGGSAPELSCLSRELADLEAEDHELKRIRNLDMKADVLSVGKLRALVAKFVQNHRDVSSIGTLRKGLTCDGEYQGSGSSRWSSIKSSQRSPGRNVEMAKEEHNAVDGDGFSAIETPNTIADEHSRRAAGGMDSRACLVAHLLVQARTGHSNAGVSLRKEANRLEEDIEDSKRALLEALAIDHTESHFETQARILDSIGLSTNAPEDPQVSRERGTAGSIEESGESRIEAVPSASGVEEAIVRMEVLQRLDNLVSTRDARLTALRDEFLREATRPKLLGISEEAALDKNGGWDADQHLRFMKVVKAAKGVSTSAIGFGGPSAHGGSIGWPPGSITLKTRLSTELPDVPESEISKHESWYRLRSVYTIKKRLEREKYLRELDDLVAWGTMALETQRKEAKENAARKRERKEQDRRREELEALLKSQRKARETRDWQKREREKREYQEKLDKESQQAEAKAVEDERKRKAVAEYHDSLRELRAREAEARKAAEMVAEAERRQRILRNSERVGFREEKSRLKQEERARLEREAEALEMKRIQVLERLAASVPYADACANAEAKLDHITVATAAHFNQFESFDRARGHHPMFGYSTSEVVRDPKFRLTMYLREAGVAGSAAAHSAVMRTVGPLPEAPF